MTKVKWTDDQLHAIESRGSSLLVSAAAGSGKTAVLVERLLRRVEEEKRDITDFLIITYTKAAASELRRKITDALYKRAAENLGDKHIRRQLALVSNARISTVHSFCTWVLRNYASSPELAGGFRVIDESESKIILDELIDELIEEKYNEKSAGFTALAEYMSGARSDEPLGAAVRELFEKSVSHPYPEKWLSEAAAMYNISDSADICESAWGSRAKAEADARLDLLVRAMKSLCADVAEDAKAEALYGDVLRNEVITLSAAKKSGWNEMYRALCDIEFARMPSSRPLEDKSVPERVKAVRARVKKGIEDIVTKCLPAEEEELLSEMRHVSGYVNELCTLARELLSRFTDEKLRRGGLDYSDLEHFTVNLLVDRYDEADDTVVPSNTARELSKSFCEILLDEFQDSNNIQDIIFRAVSRDEKNIVMVGDVKQSIYKFRLANPSIFMKKYKSFKSFGDAVSSEPRYITLSKNFRSRGEVIDAANSMFSEIMCEELGGIDYTEREYLVPRDEIPEADGDEFATEFILIDRESGDEEKAVQAEAAFVAEKIRDLVDSGFEINDADGKRRRVKYGDFAILLRSATTNAEHYEKALSLRGITFVSPRAEGLLTKPEVSVIVSMLSVIDNPMNDIPLLAVLRSPLFGYTADDLCEIRSVGKDLLIIDAIRVLAREESDTAQKCRAFLELLSELRGLATGMGADRLIWEIYNRTNAFGMFGAMKNGGIRQKNLIEFYRCACDFEKSGYHGLYKFITHIVRLIERKSDIPSPVSVSGDAVNIMTIHKSKGLEFPIVFLAGSIRNFNLDDIKSPVLIHPTLGIGMRYRDSERKYESSTLAREVIARLSISEMRSEEIRILYVAMTRAREKLYLVCSYQNAAGMIAKRIEENPYRELATDSMRSGFGTLPWMILPLLKSSSGEALYRYAGIPFCELGKTANMQVQVIKVSDIPLTEALEKGITKTEDSADPQALLRRFTFKYPSETAAVSPSKITATELGAAAGCTGSVRRRRPRPRFMQEKKLNAAERGIALHMAMQFADFSKCTDSAGAAQELQRLLSEKYLTKAQYEAVSADKIAEFVNSATGRKMLSAKRVCREYKFSVLLPADEVFKSADLCGEEILLQGVIDLYFEDDDGITIVDFKTDAERPSGSRLERYAEQIRTYRTALYEITGKTASRLVLYLVSRGEEIEI